MRSRTSPPRWDHAFLDAMRMQADEQADGVIARVVASGGPAALGGLMRNLFDHEGCLRDAPAPARELYGAMSAEPPDPQSGRLREATALYARYRPEVRIALGGY